MIKIKRIAIIVLCLSMSLILISCANTNNLGTPYTSSQQNTADGNSSTYIPNYSSQEVHIHNYSSPTCMEPAICSCGATYGSTIDHNYINGKCSMCGTKIAFETLVFSGEGKKIVRNVNLPQGRYFITVSHDFTGGNDNDWFAVRLYNGDDSQNTTLGGYDKLLANSTEVGTEECVYEGYVVDGWLEIDTTGRGLTWEITIEAF